jgi:hypothetical protein
MRVRLASTCTAAAIASLGLVPLAAPATADAASFPKSSYYLNYGHGDYVAQGNIKWLNRTIVVGGSVNAVEYNCAKIEVVAKHGSLVKKDSRIKCSGEKGYSFQLQLNVRGGVASASVRLYISNEGRHNWKRVGAVACTRSDRACV